MSNDIIIYGLIVALLFIRSFSKLSVANRQRTLSKRLRNSLHANRLQ